MWKSLFCIKRENEDIDQVKVIRNKIIWLSNVDVYVNTPSLFVSQWNLPAK